SDEDRRRDDRPEPPRRDPPCARARDGRRAEPQLCRAAGDLRRARSGEGDPPPARLSGDRHLRALDRGDGAPHRPHRRGAAGRERRPGRSANLNEKPPVPLWRWAMWSVILLFADVVFYVVLTPIWMGLRAAAWLAEWRVRRKRR